MRHALLLVRWVLLFVVEAALVRVNAGDSARSVWNSNTHILHHAFALMIEDMTVQHEVADVALVSRAPIEGVALPDE
jgi:hypothetical protein